jgi:predicted peptidase
MRSLRKSIIVLMVAGTYLLSSCGGGSDDPTPADQDTELTSLPEDTGGEHVAQVLGSTNAEFGYYVYLPGGYDGGTASYPLLVFLHGKSERGDGTNSITVLNKVLAHGPPKLIKNGTWDPTYPMIVISPQFHGDEGNENNWGGGITSNLKDFIAFAIEKYRVNTKRIYLTGLSHGGNGVYDYISKEDDSNDFIAAAVPIAAYGAGSGFSKAKNTPIWAFVGENDGANTTSTLNYIAKFNEQSPSPKHLAKLTVFPDATHDVWTRTYSGSGIGTADPAYDEFDISIYDWMLQFKRP